MRKATLSTKNQITIPVDDVRWLGAERTLLLERKELGSGQKGLLILPVSKRISAQYRGLHRRIWKSLGSAEYARKMRSKEWKP